MNTVKTKKIIFIVLCLSAISFFQPTFINIEILKWFNILGAIIILMISIDSILRKNISTSKILNLYFIGIIISVISAYLFWKQGVFESLIAIRSYFYVLIFYVIRVWNLKWNFIKKIIIIFGVIYAIFFLLNFFSYPNILFGNKVAARRDTISSNIFGIAFAISGFIFIVQNLFKKFSLLNFLLSLFIASTFVLQASRTNLFAIFFVVVFMYFSNNKLSLKKIFLGLVISSIMYISYIQFESIFNEMLTNTHDQYNIYDENARYIAAKFYLNEFSPNVFCEIFGNGFPTAKSKYGIYQTKTLWNRHIYAQDIGIIGFWAYFGLVTVFSILAIFIKMFKSNIIEIKGFVLFLIFTGLTTYNLYMPDFLILQGILFSFSYQHLKYQKYKNNIQKKDKYVS